MMVIEHILPFKIDSLDDFVPVLVDGRQIGWTTHDFSKKVSHFSDVWVLGPAGLTLSPRFTDFEGRRKAVDDNFVAMSDQGIIPKMPDYSAFGGIDWLAVHAHEDGEVLFTVKRFYACFLGIQIHSVVMNGFTGDKYWTAIRSQNVESGAGKLDLIVAGAIRHGESRYEALQHEGFEEAGLTAADLQNAVEVGRLHVPNIHKNGFFFDEWFSVFDLDLGDKQPIVNLPVEVDGFKLLTIPQLLANVENGDVFKQHINLVVTDFLIRHGHLTPDHPRFEELKSLLYRENYVVAYRP